MAEFFFFILSVCVTSSNLKIEDTDKIG